MKSGFLRAMALLLVGAGWVGAQAPAPPGPPAPFAYPPPPAAPDGPPCLPADAIVGPGGHHVYASADYILWRIRRSNLPATASVAPVGLLAVDTTDLFQTTPGGPATPGAVPVTGFTPVSIVSAATAATGSPLDVGEHSGGRFFVGAWADPSQTCGVEAGFWFLDKRTANFAAVSGNSVNQFTINTPFTQNLFLISAVPGAAPTTTLIDTFPLFFVRQASSSLVGTLQTDMWSAEANLRGTWLHFGTISVGGLVGFRYLNFSEGLDVRSSVRLFRPEGIPIPISDLAGSLPPDIRFDTRDRVITHNNFYGGQIGADLDASCYGFFVNARGKVGVGAMHQTVKIDSTSTITGTPGATGAPTSGGLLFSPDDIGKRSRDRIAFIPEANVKVGYQFNGWLRAYVGYDVLYVSDVARAADQSSTSTLNTTIRVANSTNQINVSQPTFRFRDTDLVVQGVSFGVELRY